VETDIDNREIARKNLYIVFLHSGPEKMPIPDSAWRERDRSLNGTRHKRKSRANPKALVNAAKFASARFRIAGPMQRLNCIDNRLILKRKFMTGFRRRSLARNCDRSSRMKKSVDIRRFF
jgi:hypothetical protein